LEEGLMFGIIFEDARLLVGVIAFVVYLFAKVQGDKFLFYKSRYTANKYWKHACLKCQSLKPYSNYLAFLKDGWHLMEWVKGAAIFAAIGVWDLVLGIVFAFFAYVVQKLFFK